MFRLTRQSALFAIATGLTVGLAGAALAKEVGTATAMLINQERKVVGKAQLRQLDDAVFMQIRFMGLPEGIHALHFHEKGLCEPPFKSAGGHYNPDGHHHGLRNPEGWHQGDMPNIHVPASGNLDLEILTSVKHLDELLDADGASIMIHDGADDYTSDPAGNAGHRIVCGVVEADAK